MKRKTATYKPKYSRGKYQKTKWNSAPTGQAGGTVTRIKQVVQFPDFVSAAANVDPVLTAFTFQLSDLDQVSTFADLYDMWRIDKIVMNFMPVYNCNPPIVEGTAGTGTKTGGGLLFTAKDYTNGDAPTSAQDVIQYQTVKWTPSYEPHWRSIKPQPIFEVEGVVQPLVNNKNVWYSTDDTTGAYAGIKVAYVPSPISGVEQRFQIVTTYHLSFKNVK